MNGLDLYKSLILNVSKKDLSLSEKKDFMNKIVNCDNEGHFLLYSLIKNYFIQNSKERDTSASSLIIPYNGKKNDNKIDFNLLDFPNELKQLIYKFLVLHTKKIQVDNEKQQSVSKHENN